MPNDHIIAPRTDAASLSTRLKSRLRPQASRLMLIALLMLMLIGLLGAATATGWEATLEQIRKLSLYQVLLLLLLSLMNYGLRGLRWHRFARHLGLPLPFLCNLRHFLGGFAMTVTPGRVGELVRMRWIKCETGWPIERTAPLMLVDRASDLACMAVLLALAILFSSAQISGGFLVAMLALSAAFIVTRPQLLKAIAGFGFTATGRFPRLFSRLRRAAHSLEPFTSGGAFHMGSALALVGWLAEGVAFYLLLHWLGADIDLATAIAIFLFATLAGGLTGMPGGVGGAEAAMIALLALEGVPLVTSLPATAIIRLTSLWFAIVIGLIIFPIAERQSKRVQNELEIS